MTIELVDILHLQVKSKRYATFLRDNGNLIIGKQRYIHIGDDDVTVFTSLPYRTVIKTNGLDPL